MKLLLVAVLAGSAVATDKIFTSTEYPTCNVNADGHMYVKYHRAHPLHQHFACTHAADGACSCGGHPTHGGGGCQQMIMNTGKKIRVGGECVTLPKPSGTIELVASGFNRPGGICMDKKRQVLYVTEEYDCGLKKIELSSGIVTTVAGGNGCTFAGGVGTEAKFHSPLGVGVDPEKNVIYVCDRYNRVIRKVDAVTREVTIFAGQQGQGGYVDGDAATAKFRQPWEIALDLEQQVAYVTDRPDRGGLIRKVDLTTRAVTTLQGTRNKWNEPWGIALKPAANANTALVSDQYHHVIKTVDLTDGGTTSNYVGKQGYNGHTNAVGSSARFSHPRGMAISERTNMAYVTGKSSIRTIDLTTKSVGTLQITTPYNEGGYFSYAYGITMDDTTSQDVAYVADNYNMRVVKVYLSDS
jgi:hypothetical protein